MPLDVELSWLRVKCSGSNVWGWVKSNGFAASDHSAYRGRYIHHYSTILTPYFQVKSGDYQALITSHYGAISLLPLFFLEATMGTVPFHLYNGLSYYLGFVFVVLLLGYLWIANNVDRFALGIGAVLILSWVAVANSGALAMSPGFSLYRIFPSTIIIFLLFFPLRSGILIPLAVLLGLLNSLALNILLVVTFIGLFTTVKLLGLLKDFSRTSPTINFSIIAGVFAALSFQFILSYSGSGDDFSAMKGSFFELGPRTTLGTIRSVLLMNGVMGVLFVVCLIWGNAEQRLISFSGLVVQLCISLYALKFWGSPQHRASFLFMMLPMTTLIAHLIRPDHFKKAVILPLVIMVIIVYEITYSQNTYHGIGPAKASVFDKAEVGKPLSFPLTDDVHGAFVEINSLLAKFNPGFELHSPKVFFALREKAFLEILAGKPLTPHVYDFYTTIGNQNWEQLRKIAKFEVLILPSKHQLLSQQEFLTVLQDYNSMDDFAKHLEIIRGLLRLYDDSGFNRMECSDHYCVVGEWS